MKNRKLLTLVEGGIMVAIAAVLSYIRVFKLPWGGSVTLLSMLPIAVFSIRRGVKAGLACSFVYALFELFQGIGDGLFGWGLTAGALVSCILIDYIGAFTVVGLAGVFRSKGLKGMVIGTAGAVFLRFVCHFLAGVFIWASCGMLWEGFYTENVWIYSMLYNGAYMLPEIVFTTVGAAALFAVPQTSKLLKAE